MLSSLLICLILVSLVGWFYKKYSISLGGKMHIGSVLPLIGLTVFLVITVVKSSLALSLGLVGALSIVRFRTPIKEPEELGYLFLTIAIGLGLGAGFQITTVVIVLIILGYLYLTLNKRNQSGLDGEYTLVLNITEDKFKEIASLIEHQTVASKLIRMESIDGKINIFYNISTSDTFDLQDLLTNLKEHDQALEFNFVESSVNW